MFPAGTKRQLTGCLLGVILLLTGCGADPSASDGPEQSTIEARAGAEASGEHIEIPRTPAGRQLDWFLRQAEAGQVAKNDYRQRFTEQFRSQVPYAEMKRITGGLKGLRGIRILEQDRRRLVVLTEAEGVRLATTLAVDAAGTIDTLQLQPHQERPAPPTSWSALDDRLAAVAPETGFLAAELTEDGRCVPIHQVRAGAPHPIGSMFKLYVLDTVASQVQQGHLSWGTKLTIEAEDKSLPTGKLQDRADGDTVTVAEAARLMISISDNTATDLLIERVGRGAVQRTIEQTSGNAKANIPVLTTRELFLLKGADYPTYAQRYLDLPPAQRASWLDSTLSGVPLDEVETWQQPRNTEVIGWFAAPDEICAAFARLTERDGVDRALSVNDGGLGLDPEKWPKVWFKGGSEPGVMALGYLAEATDGSRYVLTAMIHDHDTALDESTATLELLSLLEGASRLVSAPS